MLRPLPAALAGATALPGSPDSPEFWEARLRDRREEAARPRHLVIEHIRAEVAQSLDAWMGNGEGEGKSSMPVFNLGADGKAVRAVQCAELPCHQSAT
jgi:hypothetical protein